MFLTGDDVDEDTLQIGYKELRYQMPKMVRRLLEDTSRNLWWPKDEYTGCKPVPHYPASGSTFSLRGIHPQPVEIVSSNASTRQRGAYDAARLRRTVGRMPPLR